MRNTNEFYELKINSSCNGCGACFEATSYLTEGNTGVAKIKGNGIINEAEVESLREIIELCPTSAISLEKKVLSKEWLADRIRKLESYKMNIILPNNYFHFDSNNNKYKESIPFTYEGLYKDFNSRGDAKSAIQNFVNRNFYSKRKAWIQCVLAEYQKDILLPYARYEKKEENPYYQEEKKLEIQLKECIEFIQLVKREKKFNVDFTKIHAQRYSEDFEINSFLHLIDKAGLGLQDLEGESYSLDFYCSQYADIDEYEEYVGEGMFGRSKYKKKYSVSVDQFGIIEEFQRDIVSAAYYVVLENNFERDFKNFIEDYEKELKRQLGPKIKELKEVLNTL